ncbi:MAG: hypothetical protein ACKVQB_11510 [Bacteroidia bacterium]
MNTKNIILILFLCILVNACNDDTLEPTETKPPVLTYEKSKKGMLCKEWTLKETYANDVQKSTNGTGKYKFQTDGGFYFYEKGKWENIGNYTFSSKDSNNLAMTLTYAGQSFQYSWDIKKLDEKNYHIEFQSGGSKYNYNYAR